MPQKVFQRIGLRRDKDLMDVGSSTDALNNLLNGLVTKAAPASYISEDLDAIRNIWNVDLDATGFQQIIGSATLTNTGSSGGTAAISPAITYKNKLDKFRLFSGEPRIRGGNGPTARYFDSNQVDENTTNIFSGSPFKVDNFWQEGDFTWTDKLDPSAEDADGGIEWEGFFIPVKTGRYQFNIDSANCFTFDFETETYHNTQSGTQYHNYFNIGIARTFAAQGSPGNTLTIDDPNNTKYVAIGMSASEPSNEIMSDATVTGINTTTGVITFARPDGTNSIIGNWNDNVTFKKSMGQDTNVIHLTYVLKETERYSIKFRYFIPRSVSSSETEKNFNIDMVEPGASSGTLRYTNLYAHDYDFSDEAKGDFAKYLDTSILFGGGKVGLTDAGATPATKADYVKVKSTKKIDIKYKPKETLSAIQRRTPASYTTVSGSPTLTVGNTTGLEVGNKVFGTGIAADTVINDIIYNSFVILSKNMTANGSNTLTFIDHRGFVKKVTGSTSGTTLTISSGNTTNLRTDMILICNGVASLTGITTTGSSSQVTIFPSQNLSSRDMYFYESRGLINDSLGAFCTPVETVCLIVSADTNAGNTTIGVDNNSDLGSGTYSVLGSQFAANTTITGTPGNNITINNATTAKLLEGEKITATRESTDVSRRVLCCPPLDTSPPFSPTEEGLETKSIRPSLKVNTGNLKFDELTATGITTITALSSGLTETISGRVSIDTPSGTFKLLCE